MIDKSKNIFFALHLYRRPECKEFWVSLRNAATLLKQRGYIPYFGLAGCGDPYIQKSRNELVGQFLKSDCDTLVFVADDLKYTAEDLLRLVETPGEVVAGVYRVKSTKVNYPVAVFADKNGLPLVREDGCISAIWVQTGFLRIQRTVFEQIIKGYPELAFYGEKNGKKINVNHDFFPQGVRNHKWIGEDYAFCDLWRGLGGKIWIIPDVDLTHYDGETAYPGNYHTHLTFLPGGINYRG